MLDYIIIKHIKSSKKQTNSNIYIYIYNKIDYTKLIAIHLFLDVNFLRDCVHRYTKLQVCLLVRTRESATKKYKEQSHARETA